MSVDDSELRHDGALTVFSMRSDLELAALYHVFAAEGDRIGDVPQASRQPFRRSRRDVAAELLGRVGEAL